ACPTCLLNFKEGARTAGIQLQIQDLPLLLPKYVKVMKKVQTAGAVKDE
ncbi:unnamed protein product, partial [marine sediment metagenome]